MENEKSENQKPSAEAPPAVITPRRRRRYRRLYGGTVLGDVVIFAVLCILALIMLFPIFLTVVQSVKSADEFFVFPPSLLPKNISLENYKALGDTAANMWTPLSRYVFNSIFITGVIVTAQFVLSSTAAYALAKIEFRGRRVLNRLIEFSLLFSVVTLSVMIYVIIRRLHIGDMYFANTYLALILPFAATPLGIFFMRQFIAQVSDSLIEAARIDGASEFRICWNVVMPNVKPAWATLMLFAFQAAWQSDGTAFVTNEALLPIPAVMNLIQYGDLTNAGVAAAATVVTIIPPMIIFFFFRSSVIETMSYSGIRD